MNKPNYGISVNTCFSLPYLPILSIPARAVLHTGEDNEHNQEEGEGKCLSH